MEADFCFHESNKSQAWEILKETLQTKQPHRIIIKPWKNKRSLSQNSLLWMWNSDVSEAVNKYSEIKLSNEEIHEYFKDMFCPVKEINVMGETRWVKSTKLLDTEEMTFYLQRIEVWCVEKGIKVRIPENSEYHRRRLENV
ncbi:recombination protein NinB [Photorhabdus akhurstii]|uniref:recombination protein NinB n=1 Tax=Photorhabdus akhurstii TaxID=171438 RepID=UPI0037042208